MIFVTKEFYIDTIGDKDLNKIVEVYNSNRNFLRNHMDVDSITYEWMVEELDSMKNAGFLSCKIVEKQTDKLIGVLDFKIDEETYLSLLMIHSDYKNKGYGKLVYQALEKHAKSEKSMRIRIDVVTNYDKTVLDFWSRNGFVKYNDITLNWTGKTLPAVILKKELL